MPETIKPSKLDWIVQAATGWTNSRLHDWRIDSQRFGVPDEEWIGGSAMLDERKFTNGQVLGEHANTFAYGYDFGDGWDHLITTEGCLPVRDGSKNWPMCLAGENACPPEDVGGPPGYMDFLQTIRDPNHEQHADYWR